MLRIHALFRLPLELPGDSFAVLVLGDKDPLHESF